MTLRDWAWAVAVLAVCLLVCLLGLDRNRMKQRLHNAEGRVTGLTLDLDATRTRVDQLQSYLSLPGSWTVDATAPAALGEPRPATRWTAPAGCGHESQDALSLGDTVGHSVGDGATTSTAPLHPKHTF